jgi:hypothetical protein
MSKQSWRHREWHIRKELFGFKTEFEITYLAFYALFAYTIFDKKGFNLGTVILVVASFWLLAILIIILKVEIERSWEKHIGCKGDKCDYPKVYTK